MGHPLDTSGTPFAQSGDSKPVCSGVLAVLAKVAILVILVIPSKVTILLKVTIPSKVTILLKVTILTEVTILAKRPVSGLVYRAR